MCMVNLGISTVKMFHSAFQQFVLAGVTRPLWIMVKGSTCDIPYFNTTSMSVLSPACLCESSDSVVPYVLTLQVTPRVSSLAALSGKSEGG